MRRAIFIVVLTCLSVSGWVMYLRETKVSSALAAERRGSPVVVPYGLIDKVNLLLTTHRQGIKVAGSPSLRPFDSAWNELNGLVLAAMLGVTSPQAVASTGWENVPGLPKELADIVQKRPLKRLDESEDRWVYFRLDEPVSLGNFTVCEFMLFSRRGSLTSDLYVADQKGAWLHATTAVTANMLEAYIRDATLPNPD